MKTPIERTVRQGERGVALALALFAMAALMVGATSALFIGADDIKASRNYRGAAQAHFAAESGLTRAVQAINSVGVIDFKNEIVDEWSSNWFGATSQTFPLAGYSYTLTPVADATNPSQLGWIRSTAVGPENVRNVAVARVQQSNIPGTAPGAIYLANNNATDSDFQGNNFLVDGRDYNTDGTLKVGGTAMPGIATRTEANTNEAIASLAQDDGDQLDNVQGLGFQAGPPVVPSVKTAPTGANVAQLNALVDSLLAQPGVNTYDTSKINNSNKAIYMAPPTGGCGIGCCGGGTNNPKISHFTADQLQLKFNGNITGCGVMIVDGDMDIQGTIDFLGLIIVRGATVISTDSELGITGNATVYGSLWTSNLNLNVGGSAIVRYSTSALAFANSVMPTGAFPAPLNVLGLVNCAQVPAGTAGCPS